MLSHEVTNIQPLVAEQLAQRPLLLEKYGVELKLASDEHAVGMSTLYREAYERGDFFAGRYDNSEKQIFNPDWLVQDFDDPNHLWFIFTDERGSLLGSTGFFHDNDSEAGPLMTSDETQIVPAGRGKRIMDHFFKRVVPMIEQSGAGLSTDFMLTRESKGLRRTLQADLGMVALGIHPHILHHPESGITNSEISAAKYLNLTTKKAEFLSEFEPLFRIVQSQLPNLPEPSIISEHPSVKASNFAEEYSETDEPIDARDIDAQGAALQAGFQPVAYNPDRNSFRMARFPHNRPNLDFVLGNEQVEPNKSLVKYLDAVLYKK